MKSIVRTFPGIISISFIVFLFCILDISPACTVFCIDKGGNLVTGRSYDWGFGEGMVVVNKRNQTKTAFTYWEESKSNLATWTSKYGSITFVQYGREVAFDGMNEAGLVVAELWLDQTSYPAGDSRPSLSVDQYVQYLLDTCSSVDEIAASDALVRLRPTTDNFTKIHFFAVDSTGNAIVVEFLNGKMVFHTKESLSAKAITNNTYSSSMEAFNGGIVPNPSSTGSLDRFCRAASQISAYDPETSGDIVAYAYKVLDSVKQGSWTKFQTVFDIKKRVVYFKSLQNSQLRSFRFADFDYSCRSESKILDINANLVGDVTSLFVDYSTEINEALIVKAWANLGYTNVYAPAVQIISRYPETFVCRDTSDDHEGLLPSPRLFDLRQNYPNPFNPATVIRYTVNKPSPVILKIYDMQGRLIKILEDGQKDAGEYSLGWDATDQTSRAVSSGIYLYYLKISGDFLQKKMVLIR